MVIVFYWMMMCLMVHFECVSCNGSLLFGFVTDSAAYLSSSCSILQNGVMIHENFRFIRRIGDVAVGLQGDIGDCEHVFSALDAKNRLHSINFNDRNLTCKAISNMCRNIISDSLRKRQLQTNALIAGFNTIDHKPEMYWLDNCGSMQKVSHAAIGGNEFMFVLSLLDYYHSKAQSESIINEENRKYMESDSITFGKISQVKSIGIIDDCWKGIEKRGTKQMGKRQISIITETSVQDLIRSI